MWFLPVREESPRKLGFIEFSEHLGLGSVVAVVVGGMVGTSSGCGWGKARRPVLILRLRLMTKPRVEGKCRGARSQPDCDPVMGLAYVEHMYYNKTKRRDTGTWIQMGP